MKLKRKHIILFLIVAIFSLSLPTQVMCWIFPDMCEGVSVQTSLAGIIISVLLAAVTLAYYILQEKQIEVNLAFYWLHWIISLVGMIVFKYGAIIGANAYSTSHILLPVILYSLIIVQIIFSVYFILLIKKNKKDISA